MKDKTIKLLEENPYGLEVRKDCLNISYTHWKNQPLKKKVEKTKEMNVIKIKNFCSSKDTTKRVER